MGSSNLFGRLRWAPLAFEPLAFHLRDGLWWTAPPEGIEAWYKRCSSEATVAQLKALGINLVSVHFFKGFGLASPLEDHPTTRTLIDACHRHSIQVLAYVQMRSLVLEAFLEECPGAREWISVDAEGRPITFDGTLNSYHRFAPCRNSTEFVEYIQRTIALGLTEFAADGIHLDNFSWDRRACHCQRCRSGFRAYLAQKYPGDIPWTLLGIARAQHVDPPPVFIPHDSLCREWVAYKGEVMTRLLRRLRDVVRATNPNALFCVHARYPWHMGGDYSVQASVAPLTLEGAADLHVVENYGFPRITAEGELVTLAREHKLARYLDIPAIPFAWLPQEGRPRSEDGGITYIPHPREAEVQFAEQVAFGGQAMGGLWITLPYRGGLAIDDPGLAAVLRSYAAFLAANQDLFPSRPYSDLAVLRPERSLLLDYERTSPCLAGVEQLLLQGHVAWEPILERDLSSLQEYRVLVLPHASVLAEAEIGDIRQFVARGGHLVVIGRPGQFNERFRRRPASPLADLTGVAEEMGEPPLRLRQHGASRILYLSAAGFRPGRVAGRMFVAQLPDRWREITELVKSIAAPPRVHLEAPDTVLLSTAIQRETGRIQAWLINTVPPAGAGISLLTLRLPPASRCRAAWITTPERPDRIPIPLRQVEDAVEVSIPAFHVLLTCVVEYESSGAGLP